MDVKTYTVPIEDLVVEKSGDLEPDSPEAELFGTDYAQQQTITGTQTRFNSAICIEIKKINN